MVNDTKICKCGRVMEKYSTGNGGSYWICSKCGEMRK